MEATGVGMSVCKTDDPRTDVQVAKANHALDIKKMTG
jgi:hypothetical protein